MFSYSSLVAAVVGLVAFTIDLIVAALSDGTPAMRFSVVYTIAGIVGVICGSVARKELIGQIGLHLSWAPLTAVVLILIALNRDLSVAILKAVLGALVMIVRTFIEVGAAVVS